MENLKLHIEERLWNFIKRNYNSENYSNAILDSIQFIGDIIREKSGLDSDGVQLVGAALGGENPKIKLNELSTESERNFQKGVESILRGFYTAYRNPRSHSKVDDSELNAFEIITFLNHLLKIIDKSTGKFSIDIFLKRVLDQDFVQSNKYAELLINDIPSNKYFETCVEIFRSKDGGKIVNLRLVWSTLFGLISEEQKLQLAMMAADELRYTESVSAVTKCIALFKTHWELIPEDARLRGENKLINSVKNAQKTEDGELNEAAVWGTWLASITPLSGLQENIAELIYDLLNSNNQNKQRFVLEYFGRQLKALDQHLMFESFVDVLKKELERGNELVYSYIMIYYKKDQREEFEPEFSSFTLKPLDELPF